MGDRKFVCMLQQFHRDERQLVQKVSRMDAHRAIDLQLDIFWLYVAWEQMVSDLIVVFLELSNARNAKSSTFEGNF